MHIPITLALDFGTKRIGTAISRGTLAEPLEIISYQDLEHALQQLKELCAAEAVTQLLVGVSEQKMAELSQEFGQRLHVELGLPVMYTDETLSSHTVQAKLKETRNYRPWEKKPIDHLAAAEFLQEWLDEQ